MERVLFVRIGCHSSYAGPQDENDWPKGAGNPAVNLHAEAFNFFDFGETWYGMFGMGHVPSVGHQNPKHPGKRRQKRLDLRRIYNENLVERPTRIKRPTRINGVLVIFVAKLLGNTKDAIDRQCQGSGQRIVGWYRDATVHDNSDLPKYPEHAQRSIKNHLATRNIKSQLLFTHYQLSASRSNCTLLPPLDRMQFFREIPHQGPGSFGQSNVCYRYDEHYNLKTSSPWIQEAIDQIAKR